MFGGTEVCVAAFTIVQIHHTTTAPDFVSATPNTASVKLLLRNKWRWCFQC